MTRLPVNSNARATAARAFTLLELVVVAAVLAVLAAIAAPRFGSASANARLDAVENRIESEVLLAATLARSTSREHWFDADVDRNAIIVGLVDALGSDRESWDIDLSKGPYRATITGVGPDATARYRVDPWGVPSGVVTIDLRVGGESRVVTVGSGGGT